MTHEERVALREEIRRKRSEIEALTDRIETLELDVNELETALEVRVELDIEGFHRFLKEHGFRSYPFANEAQLMTRDISPNGRGNYLITPVNRGAMGIQVPAQFVTLLEDK